MNTLLLEQFINEHLINYNYNINDNILHFSIYEYDDSSNIIYKNIINYINNQDYSQLHKFFIDTKIYSSINYYFFIRINKCYYLSCTYQYDKYDFCICQFKSKFSPGNHIRTFINMKFNINSKIDFIHFNTVLYNRLVHEKCQYIFKYNILIYEKLQILLQACQPYYLLQNLKE